MPPRSHMLPYTPLFRSEEQANTAKSIFYGPVNKMAKLDAETAKSVVYGPEAMAKLTVANWEIVNQKRHDLPVGDGQLHHRLRPAHRSAHTRTPVTVQSR